MRKSIAGIMWGSVFFVPQPSIANEGGNKPSAVRSATSGSHEEALLDDWIATGIQILQSDLFLKNLSLVLENNDKVYLRADTNWAPLYGSVKEVTTILRGAGNYHYVEVSTALTGGKFDGTAQTGFTGYTDKDGFQYGSMTLGRQHLTRWQSKNRVEKSCAINTMVHELSHTITTDPKFFFQAFTDNNRRQTPWGTPAASYLIGSVAQCTWLQGQGRISDDELKSCVTVFGTRHFNSNRCSEYDDTENLQERRIYSGPAQD